MQVKTNVKAGQASSENRITQSNDSMVTVSQTNTSRIGGGGGM
jgi:hypothetical protein